MPAAVKILTNVQVARELGAAIGGAITNTVANPTVVTTTVAHGLIPGDVVNITGSNSTPSLNGNQLVTTVPLTTTFTVPVNVTIAGTAGTVKKLTKGTTPAAGDTWRRLTGEFELTRGEDLEMFEDLNVGLYIPSQTPIVVRKWSEFTLTAPCDFTQPLLGFLTGMRGGIVPTGGGADKTWSILPGMTALALEDTYTFEANETDGAVNAIIRFNYAICDSIEITGGTDGVGQIALHFFGRAPVDATAFTATTPGAAPALSYAANLRWQCFLDATWAAMTGGTPTALGLGQMYAFAWKWSEFIFPQYYQDGRATLDFSTEITRKPMLTLGMDVVSDPLTTSFVQVEEAQKLTGALRFIMLRLLGPTLGGSAYKLDLQGAYVHASDSMKQRLTERDGNLVTRAMLVGRYDPTSTNAVQVIAVNDRTAFP
jgi:hypothetical protein